MSLISCIGCVVEDSVFANTNGTAPMSGLDIEPDNIGASLDVVFRRCHAANNSGCGYSLQLDRLEPIVDLPISITFDDCHATWADDFEFKVPASNASGRRAMFGLGAGFLVDSPKTAGTVSVVGGSVRGSGGPGIEVRNKQVTGPLVSFSNMLLIDVARVDRECPPHGMHGCMLSQGMHSAPIVLVDSVGGLGGIHFHSITIANQSRNGSSVRYEAVHCSSTLTALPCHNRSLDITGEILAPGGDDEGVERCGTTVAMDGETVLDGPSYPKAVLENVSIRCVKTKTAISTASAKSAPLKTDDDDDDGSTDISISMPISPLAALIYNHGGPNATNRSLLDVLRERVSVKDFGE